MPQEKQELEPLLDWVVLVELDWAEVFVWGLLPQSTILAIKSSFPKLFYTYPKLLFCVS